MVVALTIEGKHEPMERRPNQCSNWQEDGYDNRRQPQIRLEINGGRAIRAGPVVNREPYPLWVYEHQNQGAPRRRDDDNLQRGVFYDLFEMVMIFDFHNWWIFNKGNNEGWIIHLEKKMIFVSIIELTIKVKITKNLRWRWIYQVLTVDYTLNIFSIRFIL